MADSYIVHVSRRANDEPRYITGHIEVAATGHKIFFSNYDGMLRALSVIAAGEETQHPAETRAAAH